MHKKFAIGDVVRCIEPDYTLVKDKTYKVLAVEDFKSAQLITVDEPWAGWRDSKRFVLVERSCEDWVDTVDQIISRISYKPGWQIIFERGDRPYLQISVTEEAEASEDSAKRDGTRTPWKGAKRYLSQHMCRQEIVGLCFDMIKAAEMHEVHEWFRYKNASIFNPHLDPDVLAEVASRKANFNVRDNAMSMVEDEELEPRRRGRGPSAPTLSERDK